MNVVLYQICKHAKELIILWQELHFIKTIFTSWTDTNTINLVPFHAKGLQVSLIYSDNIHKSFPYL